MSVEYILKANIAHYERLLSTEADPTKLATIRSLLAEERNKLGKLAPDTSQQMDGAEKPEITDL